MDVTNGATFKGLVNKDAIEWEKPAQADGELWQLQPDGRVIDREGVFWTRTVATTTPITTTPLPTSTPVATTTLWGPKWLHAIGLYDVAALESSRGHESSNSSRPESTFQGFWTSSKGIWVNVFTNDSQATGYTNGATFKGLVNKDAIEWEKPAQADGELWQLQPDGRVIDREGVFWTRTVATTTPITTTPLPTFTPVATTTLWGPKWLHAIGLSDVAALESSRGHESSNSSRPEGSFQGFWTSSKGIW